MIYNYKDEIINITVYYYYIKSHIIWDKLCSPTNKHIKPGEVLPHFKSQFVPEKSQLGFFPKRAVLVVCESVCVWPSHLLLSVSS